MTVRADPAGSVLDRIKRTLVSLRMPRALEMIEVTVRQLERGEVTPLEAIEGLLAEELTLRESRRIKTALVMAWLATIKTLAGFDFAFQPSLDRNRVLTLAQLDFIDRHEVVHLLGPPDPASWCPSRYHPIEAERFAADRQTADGAGDEHRRFASPSHRQDRKPGSPREFPCSAEWPAGSSPGRAGAPLLRSP